MTEPFVPLLAPEIGWIPIGLGAGAAVSEFLGVGERAARKNFAPDAPFRLLLCVRVALHLSVLLLGVSLLVQERTLFSWSLGLGALVIVVGGVLFKMYSREK